MLRAKAPSTTVPVGQQWRVRESQEMPAELRFFTSKWINTLMSVHSSLPEHRPGGVGGTLPWVCQGEPSQISYTVKLWFGYFARSLCGCHLSVLGYFLSFKETLIPFQLEGSSVERKCHMVQRDGQLWINKVTTAGEVAQSSAMQLSTDALHAKILYTYLRVLLWTYRFYVHRIWQRSKFLILCRLSGGW